MAILECSCSLLGSTKHTYGSRVVTKESSFLLKRWRLFDRGTYHEILLFSWGEDPSIYVRDRVAGGLQPTSIGQRSVTLGQFF